jgi:hypothetical protein
MRIRSKHVSFFLEGNWGNLIIIIDTLPLQKLPKRVSRHLAPSLNPIAGWAWRKSERGGTPLGISRFFRSTDSFKDTFRPTLETCLDAYCRTKCSKFLWFGSTGLATESQAPWHMTSALGICWEAVAKFCWVQECSSQLIPNLAYLSCFIFFQTNVCTTCSQNVIVKLAAMPACGQNNSLLLGSNHVIRIVSCPGMSS